MSGTTTDPTDFWGGVIYTIQMSGHCNGAGNGARYAKTVIYYEGSSGAGGISGAADLRHHSNGTKPDFQVNLSGWVATLQYKLAGSQIGFNGTVAVEIIFGNGAGNDGQAIEWVVY